MQKNNFGSVSAVILNGEEKVLLEKRSDVPIWALPGGDRLKGENLKNATAREVREETGLKAKILRYVGEYHSGYLRYNDTTHVFLCGIAGGKLRKNFESKELGFFDIENLPRHLLFIHMERIMDALAGNENVNRHQRIRLSDVLINFDFNPVILWKLALFSWRRVF